jgi:hypothetical protein
MMVFVGTPDLAAKLCAFGRPHNKHASREKSEAYGLSSGHPFGNPLSYTA